MACRKCQQKANIPGGVPYGQKQSRPRGTTKKSGQRSTLYRDRIKVCEECPRSFLTLGRLRCSECKCFMEVKTRIKSMRCPLGKW